MLLPWIHHDMSSLGLSGLTLRAPPRASGPCGPGSPFCRYPDAKKIQTVGAEVQTHQTTGVMPTVGETSVNMLFLTSDNYINLC